MEKKKYIKIEMGDNDSLVIECQGSINDIIDMISNFVTSYMGKAKENLEGVPTIDKLSAEVAPAYIYRKLVTDMRLMLENDYEYNCIPTLLEMAIADEVNFHFENEDKEVSLDIKKKITDAILEDDTTWDSIHSLMNELYARYTSEINED